MISRLLVRRISTLNSSNPDHLSQTINSYLTQAYPCFSRSHLLRGLAWGGVCSGVLNGLLAQSLSAQSLATIPFQNTAVYSYETSSGGERLGGSTNQLSIQLAPLVDPLGRILGCGGQTLDSYRGFSVALYTVDSQDPTVSELGRLVPLTVTEVPDQPNNGISVGLLPNAQNQNPFNLGDFDGGRYNFLLDPNKGQTRPGQRYILVVNPPIKSIYRQRRIRLDIVDTNSTNPVALNSGSALGSTIVRYLATSLDGQPISSDGGTQLSREVVFIPSAETVGLNLFSLALNTVLCRADQISITKTADRLTAEPGDAVIYRLVVRNQSDVALDTIDVTDSLPRGLNYIPGSVRAEIAGQPVAIAAEMTQTQLKFRLSTPLALEQTINLVYGVNVTPDGVRGDGQNIALVSALRRDNRFGVSDGPAVHKLRIQPGIIADCGTLIGRVFEDKNQDGEQQNQEPGIANAVIFMQDGNRIVTDENGLFSVGNALPGYHIATLDLSSIPGYDIAPNAHIRDRNSLSRLVNLAPGSMARINFAVIPQSQGLGD